MLVTMLGSFAVSTPSGGVDVLYIFYYGVVVTLQALFDVVLCMERAVLLKEHGFFDKEAPMMHNTKSAVFLLCPVVEFAAGVVCFLLFREEAGESWPLLGGEEPDGWGALPPEAVAAQIDLPPQNRQQARTFQPYQGRPFRLGQSPGRTPAPKAPVDVAAKAPAK